MELEALLQVMIEQSPTIGFMVVMIYYGIKRLDEIVDRCMTNQENLIERLMSEDKNNDSD